MTAEAKAHVEEAEAATLARRYQAGEADALEALHTRLEPAIRFLLRSYRPRGLPSPIGVDDLHQQSWIVLAELAGRWRPPGSFIGYFFRSFPRAIRRYVQAVERNTSAADLDDQTGVGEMALAYTAQSPEWAIRWSLELAQLPANERTVLLLRTLDQQDFMDIARQLDVSLTAVQRLFRRARERLAAQLRADEPLDDGVPPLERLVRVLHASAKPDGTTAGRRRVLLLAGLTRRRYEAFMHDLEQAGVIRDRATGNPGRLVTSTPNETLHLLTVRVDSRPPG